MDPISFLGFGAYSLLKAAIAVDAIGKVLAQFLNPVDRPAWGRAVGDPSWTDQMEARFRAAVMGHAAQLEGAVAVVFDPGKDRGERVDLKRPSPPTV